MSLAEEMNRLYYHLSVFELRLMHGNEFYNGLSYNSMQYLNLISQTPDCTPSRLAEILNVTKPAVTSKINALVRRGAVVKEHSATDGRVCLIRISPALQEIFKAYDRVFERAYERVRERYTRQEWELFGRVLADVTDGIDEGENGNERIGS